ncbi:DUF2796 domain-containing protein [Thauera sinica]|uniref:DUF2796 domain-containing protein n=1 Tax=Thauera sinica TaxID=2665146 RepID=A0ABW1AT17_9RHOO|nr:DUF2796 domain-containing protein [Thauera sp. K11]
MRFALSCIALALASPAWAAPAHVHGEARLEIAVDGNTLAIHLETPLDGLLGFERAPRSPAERQAVTAMRTTLEQPDRLFRIVPEAGCEAQAPQLESPIFEGSAGDGHLDLDADYRWQCARPSALRGIDTTLFAEFPRLKRIEVEFVGPAGQRSGRLTPARPRFAW